VPVLRPIEGHPTTAVACAKYRDLHLIPPSPHLTRTL
jgi:hypothetical protein